jgi:PTH1 family peptidyl-tRNA hydrolase
MIIFALGNPGKRYATTRHNAGFLALDKIRADWNFPDFKDEKKFRVNISEGILRNKKGETKIILIKPRTFMNESGKSVQIFLSFYKLPIENIVVIHDDLDIPLGKFKLAEDSRSAGHKGVQNIIDILATQKFTRVRIGIGKRPVETQKEISPPSGKDYVLENFSKKEIELLEKVFEEIENELRRMALQKTPR